MEPTVTYFIAAVAGVLAALPLLNIGWMFVKLLTYRGPVVLPYHDADGNLIEAEVDPDDLESIRRFLDGYRAARETTAEGAATTPSPADAA